MNTAAHPPQVAAGIAALIPAFNEEPVMEGTIQALLTAGCPARDIYVVDDRSTDRTAEIARRMAVHVFTVPVNGGKARAQAAALTYFGLHDRYGWVLFLDGDTKVDPNFMDEMRRAAWRRPDVALFVGQVRSVRNTHLFSALRAMEYAFGHDLIKQGQSNCRVILVSPGCASMYRTQVLKQLHIDHSTLAEDMDLTIQAHRQGELISYVPTAIVNTQDPSTFKDYYKQILRWDRGFWQIVKKHQVFNPRARKQLLDLYVMFLIADALFFNKLIIGGGIALAQPALLPYAFAADFFISLCVASYGACRTRRLDVLYKFPAYYWMSYVNYYAFLSAMLDIVFLRRTKLNWNKVKRYDFDSHAATAHPLEGAPEK
jgi:biofilm PGA synthesis N-glycosyltransferase PgaC